MGPNSQRREIKPARQIWCRSAAPWINAIGELPAREAD
jgi:hypothetical protein